MLRVHIERPQIGSSSLVPVIDGSALTELVGTFERESGYCPAGGYAGIFPELFPFGDLAAYLTGRDTTPAPTIFATISVGTSAWPSRRCSRRAAACPPTSAPRPS